MFKTNMAQTVSLADDGFGPTVADLVAPYWERPAGPTWWCHVAAGHTSVQAWLNNAKWLHPAKPEREIKRNGREQQRRRKRSQSRSRTVVIYIRETLIRTNNCSSLKFGHQILIYTVLSFATRRSIWCICLVSRSPSFGILRTALEELFALCFSPAGSSKPLWDVILYMVSDVPLPTPGKDLVLFAIENCLLSVEAPPKDGLPHVEVPDYILIALNSASTLLCYAYKNDAVNFNWNITSSMPTLHYFFSVELIIVSTPYMTGLHSSVGTPCNGWCSGCGP
ncbi:DENN DOMAIN-CONTAINING PROTEIN 3 [Salix koriyanagi]|uniref:DENN DOMAIN-CONTAINING PROTEIN 3 n=1 Tax=Salix koriyanagi TaxID=2511006 RepID=A0A9Q0SVD6_9ROSI|nr:DENN DOMAIN-CONTAINING PROTEIN 3 [Salix koriyanagi]